MWFMIFVLILLPLIAFFFIHKHVRNNHLLPPGPSGLPLIGNLHQLLNPTPHISLFDLSQKHGPLMSLRLGFRRALVVSSAKLAKEVLKTKDMDICSRPALLGQQKLSYNGLDLSFAPFDPYYKDKRKIWVVNFFSTSRAKISRAVMEDEVSRMLENISNIASENKSINLSKAMLSLTTTFICRVGFGKRYEGSEINKFHGLLEETQVMIGGFFVSDYFPLTGWVDRLSGMISRLENVYKELDDFYQQLIDEHLDSQRSKNEEEDFIDVLLRMLEDPDHQSSVKLSVDRIKAILMDVFVAASDTGAATVVWAMTFLMKHPTSMKKAQEEVRKIVGDKGFVNEDHIQYLPYLKSVVKETFRLQTTVPLLLPRETIRSCNVDGYQIPAKTLVYVNAWAIGRDTEAWGENSNEFCPERFIDSSIDYKGQDFGLLPFGSGRRMCPGMNMGAMVVELALANLIYRFDWELPLGMKREDIDFDSAPGVTAHKKNALCLMAREYKR